MVEKDYNNLLKNMESDHWKAVEELENLYEKKLAYENEKYICLEQQKTEEQLKHQLQVKQLGGENRQNLTIIKGKFEGKFTEVKEFYDKTKGEHELFQKELIEKLSQQEEEYE